MAAESRRATVRRLTQQTLRQDSTAAALDRLLAAVYQQAAAAVEQVPARAPLACASGCAFCCYHPVDMTPPEAFAISQYLQASLPADTRAALSRRIATQADRLRGLSYEAHAQARLPCALLVDGQCSVYPCRPFACRAWNSTSAVVCETIFRHGSPVTHLPALDMPTYEAVWQVGYGVTDGLQREGRDGTAYELHSLLQCVLTTPEALQRWAQGEAVFAGCTVGAFAG
ncbi:MAG: YkgJ family cysteine cluster protein [Candidatus Tectimicrobiota bacterium]